MKRFVTLAILAGCVFISVLAQADESEDFDIREYVIKRVVGDITIDGNLDEPEWKNADFTEEFVIYTDGTAPKFPTQVQMLWDVTYLYVAFTMTDVDVSGETKTWVSLDLNGCLCSEEVAEVFIDPDDDGMNYMEVEVNPLGAVMDLWLDKAFKEGGKGDFEWKFEGLVVGTSVDGTLNDLSDIDTKWICEMALPFKTMEFTSTTANFPPKNNDSWRINVYRYDYDNTGNWHDELSGWNQTGTTGGFHVPERFGRVFFSDEPVVEPTAVDSAASVSGISITRNYPNPFNPSTTIEYTLAESGFVTLTVFNVAGQNVRTLVSAKMPTGSHSVVWNGKNDKGTTVTSGVYFTRLLQVSQAAFHRVMFVK